MTEIDLDVDRLAEVKVTDMSNGHALVVESEGVRLTLRLYPEVTELLHTKIGQALSKDCAPRSTAAMLARSA